MLAMAGVVLLPLMTLALLSEPETETTRSMAREGQQRGLKEVPAVGVSPGSGGQRGSPFAAYAELWRFFQIPNARWWLVVMMLIFVASTISGVLARSCLVDLGFSTDVIAWLTGLFGLLLGLLGAFLGGELMSFKSRRAAIVTAALFELVGSALFVLLLGRFSGLWAACLVFGFSGLSNGLASTVVSAICMDFTRRGSEGTDYALQNSVLHWIPMGVMPLAGALGDKHGYRVAFLVALGFAALTASIVLFTFRQAQPRD